MNEFVLGKHRYNICDLESNVEYIDKLFSNERPDSNFKKEKLDIQHSTFTNIGFREANIKNSNLSHNVFVSCYFKKSNIWNVNFTGCTFINCKFDDVDIEHSDFIYANFENCYIMYDIMYNNLPREFNLRENLCRNFSMECIKAGMDDDYKKYYFEERKAREKNYYEIFRLNTKPYYKDNNMYQKIIAFFKYMQSKVSKVLWGYGENIWQLICSMLFINMIYVIIYMFFGESFSSQVDTDVNFKFNILNAIYFSISNFFTSSSGYYANNLSLRIIILSQYFVGVTFIGCFTAALYRNINRR
ncbi:pentapeptide repeat-containing protein [Clostridium butyricum]|uniref:pentapeptide repeat-containing protein n=1 Tax=Clostridium TaxID=1485 RepID=UPI00225060F8|nr:pentapeptide repeat-containing protein [Clostridium sp. LQ25]UZT08398.1 pentapeptide repeat-containing protein [Clostridium sp. LQ25]